MAEIVIHRAGVARYERAVRITQNINEMWVDPQEEFDKLGIWLSRQGCVVSFAAGLIDAGFDVCIDDCFNHHFPRFYRFKKNGRRITLLYYLLGKAWGKNEWENLLASLERYVHAIEWQSVLEHTARYYFDQPFHRGKIHLVIP